MVIQKVIPVFEDFEIEIVTEGVELIKLLPEGHIMEEQSTVIKLIPDKSIVCLYLQDENTITKLISEMKKVQAVAKINGINRTKQTHEWSIIYTKPFLFTESDFNEFSFTVPESDTNPFEENHKSGIEETNIVKQNWITNQLMKRKKEFTQYTELKIFVGTWNVNGKVLYENLDGWINLDEDPDIIALGFQEVDSSASAFLLDSSGKEEEWTRSIESFLKLRGSYVKILSRQLVGMLSAVYVKQEIRQNVTNVSSGSLGTGVLGIMGNKGGIAIKFQYFNSMFCFVNSHLAAGHEELERRNEDYKDICSKLYVIQDFNQDNTLTHHSILESDYLIWLGDLNYRVQLPDLEVRQLVDKNEYDTLMKSDQLSLQRKERRAFGGFEEGVISFPPTYKYDVGSDNFDSSEKKRAPAWCDRVLWRSGDKLKQVFYKSHMFFKTSDHKPVSSLFIAEKVKIFSKQKMNDVQMEIVREIDKYENEKMPDAEITINHIDFKNVKFLTKQTKQITLKNLGQVLLQFRFIPKLEEKSICKPFIWVNPLHGMLLPEEEIQLSFTILIDHHTAPRLNEGTEILDDILVLHLEKGKDMFISVTGVFSPTCFAIPLEKLVKKWGPMKPQPGKERFFSNSSKMLVPKELWRMIDYIKNNGLGTEGIFITSGNPEEMEEIRDCLDEGRDFKDGPFVIFSMCDTLVKFFESLPEPLMTFPLYSKCIESSQNISLSKSLVNQLPTINFNVFIYMTSFLREIVKHSTNGLTPQSLALIFGEVFIRSAKPTPEKLRQSISEKKAAFLIHFLNPNE